MNEYSRNLPEPEFAEHTLIRQAGTLPVLSSELKQRVLADCQVQMAIARRKWRLKVAGSVLAACCVLMVFVPLLLNRRAPETDVQSSADVRQSDSTSASESRSNPQSVRSVKPAGMVPSSADDDNNSQPRNLDRQPAVPRLNDLNLKESIQIFKDREKKFAELLAI